MRKTFSPINHQQHGVVIVEFALIGIIAFALTFGIITYAVMLYDYAVITNASREGARQAVVVPVSGRYYPSSTTCTINTTSTVPLTASGTSTLADAERTGQCHALSYLGNNLINLAGASSVGPSNIVVTSALTGGGTCAAGAVPQCAVKVAVNYIYNGIWFLKSFTLNAYTTMYYE